MTSPSEASWSVLLVDDDPGVRQSLRLCLEAGGARVLGVGTKSGALEALDRSRFDVVFLDLWLGAESGLDVLPEILRRQPDAGVIVITAFATFETAVEAMKLGAVDYLPKPFTPEQVRHAARRVVEASLLRRRVSELEDRLDESNVDSYFESASASFRTFLQAAGRAASADCVVLLRGESGTGKNVLARWLRDHSPRTAAPFVSVNCPALSTELMSSTLFGHKKGAFTGAVADAIGKVQQAEGGTLFLDEVGDLTTDAQTRLLRFLNDRSFERLGEPRERKADVRLVAATNRPLEREVGAGRFREDLFFRLNVVTLVLPPLRERREDVAPLARHYLRFFRRGKGPLAFSAAAEAAIEAYDWPGNLRELRNAVERATILAPRPLLEPIDLGIPATASPGPRVDLGADVSLEDLERAHVAAVVARAASLEAAARTLGIDVTTLQRKRKRYGLALAPRAMMTLGLRPRFLLAGTLLVLLTVTSGLWSAFAFARLGQVVGDTLKDAEQTTAATSGLTGALEREDDALLLALTGDARAAGDLAAERAEVNGASARLSGLLTTPEERATAADLAWALDAYQAAGDRMIAFASEPDALVRYHRDVNPLLRRAVARASGIRDQHVRSTERAAAYARDEARRATGIVSGISLGALLLSVFVSLHLARVVVWPLQALTRGVDALREGDFAQRIALESTDELGRLAAGFNRMADHLAQFRRTNIGEVLRAKQTLEATLAALPDAVIIVDPEGLVSSANAPAGALLGGEPGARQRVEDLPLPETARASIREALEGRGRREAPIDLSRSLDIPVDGEPRRLLPRVVPVPGFSAGRHGAVLVLYDVTELVRLDEMRVELVAVASHELRTPLTTLRMTLSMLQEGAVGLSPRQQDLLATSLLGVDQLATTIDEFLDLTRIEAGQLRLHGDRLDAGALVGQAARALRPRCEEAEVSLVLERDADAPTVLWGDAARLGVVLSNILANALKYTPPGGVISVHSRALGRSPPDGPDELQIEVTDSGPGVPDEYRERIFEKFFRVEHHQKGQDQGVKGSGIGLYLARQIMAAHGGQIECAPAEAGRGARIAIRLPLRPPHGAPRPP